MTEELSAADVNLLLSDGSERARATVAIKLAKQFALTGLGTTETKLAQDILGLLVRDVSASVREALSLSLCRIPGAPHHIVCALAKDIDSIALPVLEYSSVLTEEDLIDLAISGTSSRQCAIARRADIQPPLSDALVNAGDSNAIKTLIENSRAAIRSETFERIIVTHGEDETIAEPLARRADVPALLVEKLIRVASARLRTYLIERHGIDAERAQWLESRTRERSLSDMMDVMNAADMMKLARRLAEDHRLTPNLVFRAACLGEMPFVEASFAQMAGIPEVRAWKLIHDVGALGFRALYARAGMPENMFDTFQAVVDIFHELSAATAKRTSGFRREMISRVLAKCENLDMEDEEFLRSRLSRLSVAA